MVLALGAVLTCIVFLLFGRLMWSVAMAAGTRKRTRQQPIEILELKADRDRLRAEHALMVRKLDLRLDDIKLRMAEQAAEVTRNRNRVQNLLIDMDKRGDILEKVSNEKANLATRLLAAETEVEAANRTIENLSAEGMRRDAEMEKLQKALRKTSANLHEKQGLVANLNEALAKVLRGDTSEAKTAENGEVVAINSKLRQRVAEIAAISADISKDHDPTVAESTEEPPVVAAPVAHKPTLEDLDLQAKVDETARIADDIQRELKVLDQLLEQSAPTPTPVAANSDEPAPDTSSEETKEQPKRQGAMANVISMAQRIRALQQNMGDR